MNRELNIFQHKVFEKRMDEQSKLGYPNFKKGIADALSQNFELDYENALHLAFLPEIDKQIMDDVVWAQHMGIEYWAEVIAFKHLQ
jgi:hypothetical protein